MPRRVVQGSWDQSEWPWNYPHPRRRPAHTTGVQKLTLKAKESMNGLLRQRGDQATAPEKNARPRARPGEGSGGDSGGPAPPRSAYGDSRTLRLRAEAAGLGARIWELENRLRRTSGRNHLPLPLPGCACLEPPPLSSFRRSRRTRVPTSAALQPKMISRHPPLARSSPVAAL